MRFRSLRAPVFLLALLLPAPGQCAEESTKLLLPAPRKAGGMPLLQAFASRSTARVFSDRPVAPPLLADLLWAAFGVNRPDTGRRTAPSTLDARAVDIYVVSQAGTFLYAAEENALHRRSTTDLRPLVGGAAYARIAPVTLLYVADLRKLQKLPEPDRPLYAAADSGFIGQNVYLFCASEGLAAVVHADPEREALAKALKFSPEQRLLLAQTVGYPAP